MSTHNLCFGTKKKKNRYTPTYPFYYIKGGFMWVYIARTCFPDDYIINRDVLVINMFTLRWVVCLP